MANKEITFYTHPSVYGNMNLPEQLPYDRVAGLMVDGEALWAKSTVLACENAYRRTDTEPLTMNLPERLANAVADYFRDFYANPPYLYAVSNPLAERNTQSNCHRFGVSVWTNKPQALHNAASMASHVISSERRMLYSAVPPLGELAVIGTVNPEDHLYGFKGSYPHHTMVSLGNSRYLQVTALAGNLGITHSTEEIVEYYRNRQHPAVDIYHSQHLRSLPSDHQFIDSLRRAFG